ncbi:MAG TPA: putative peptidoglycan binding domain-containing protein, partial [Hyphomicrobiaceae bacterium]
MPNAGRRIRELACRKTSGLVLIFSGLAIAGHGALSDFDSGWAPSVASPNVQSQGLVVGTSLGAVASPMPGDGLPAAASSAPVIVTLAPRSQEAGVARVAAIPRDRDSLARELQKELRRVGCYEGELNGVWTPATRRAMKTFTDRVNAT